MKASALMLLFVVASIHVHAQNPGTYGYKEVEFKTKEKSTEYGKYEYKQRVNDTVDEIKQVIQKSYVDGIHNGGSIQDIKDGFHESFIMFRYTNDGISTTAISDWINSIEKGRERNPDQKRKESKAEFKSIQLQGNSVSVTLDLMRDGETIFTDHILLYEFNDGWKMISKTFYRH